jgi:hypothetical protein
MSAELSTDLPPSYARLATGLDGGVHLLSIGDDDLAGLALAAAKDVFDYGTPPGLTVR